MKLTMDGTRESLQEFGSQTEVSPHVRIDRLEAKLRALLARLDPLDHRVSPAESAPLFTDPVSFNTGRAKLARHKLRERRQREQFLPADIFADPAWDMLLDLYAAHYEEREVSVSSLCIAANVPATTALRWIKNMTDQGLFERAHDPQDGRRILIAICEGARAAMDGYFDRLAE